MTRVVYVNGRYLPYADAAVHAEDRGFQFADAVYEVCEVKGGRLVDETRHMQRLAPLARRAAHPAADGARRLVARAARDHPAQSRRATASSTCRFRAAPDRAISCFPSDDVLPTVVCLARSVSPARLEAAAGDGHRHQDHARYALGRAATSRR